MRRTGSPAELLTLGGRVPPQVGGLIAGLVLLSILGQLVHGLAPALALVPAAVLEGELWRLVSWALVEVSPLGVLVDGLLLYWFGRDLCHAWGPRRFLATAAILAAATGLLASLLALAVPRLDAAVWIGPGAVLGALTLAWGLLFPERQILFNFLFPVSGRALAWLTVGLTVFFAIFEGWRVWLPHFLAQGLMALWFRGLSPRGAWQSLRMRLAERRLRQRARHLKVVGRNGKGDPPRWMN
jgi:membrane associated rhomboid family serine protease